MKPEIDFTLRSISAKLLSEVAPAIGDPYVRSNVEVIAGLMMAAAEEYDRAAHVRAEENGVMRQIFREAAPFVTEASLRMRLEAAAREPEASFLVSDLSAANDRLRALLVELHAFVEVRDEEWALRTNRAIWDELDASTKRRALSFWPL